MFVSCSVSGLVSSQCTAPSPACRFPHQTFEHVHDVHVVQRRCVLSKGRGGRHAGALEDIRRQAAQDSPGEYGQAINIYLRGARRRLLNREEPVKPLIVSILLEQRQGHI